MLRREDDLTAVPKGEPVAPGSPAPVPSPQLARVPPPAPVPGEGSGSPRPSLTESLRRLERTLGGGGTPGVPSGTGQQMGPLFFDPEGADFTAWINQFKNQVYRNWIVPESVLMGARGHVDLEFTVQRDGRMVDVRLLKSSGTASLDRAARNALLGSQLLPLPADFRPSSVTIQVSFFYNEGPRS